MSSPRPTTLPDPATREQQLNDQGSMVPMRVTAELEAGIAHAHPWGIALDGLLASLIHAAAGDDNATGVLDLDEPPLIELPLARCGSVRSWHWAATCSYPLDGHDQRPALQHWMTRTDHAALEALSATLPKTLSDARGPYRVHRVPVLVTTCTAVSWHAIGDPAQVTRLLEPVAAIGKKRAHGHGRVLSWTIEPASDLEAFDAAHLHPDGSLGRPAPTSCLTGRDVADAGIGLAGIRPPYIHPATQARLRLPTHPTA